MLNNLTLFDIFQDWWNSTSFSNYYRTWNVVVHDWLYTYVYKDVCRVGVKLSVKSASQKNLSNLTSQLNN